MNNIRQIITERLENAKMVYRNASEILELKGQIEAYQDCLNLIQPRTEADILKDFEKLGYVVVDNNKHELILVKDMRFHLIINKELKHYMVVALSPILTMQEHKLLNELFEVLGE